MRNVKESPRQSCYLLTEELFVADRTVELVVVLVESGGGEFLLTVDTLETEHVEGGPVGRHVGLPGKHGLLRGVSHNSTQRDFGFF